MLGEINKFLGQLCLFKRNLFTSILIRSLNFAGVLLGTEASEQILLTENYADRRQSQYKNRNGMFYNVK